MPKHLFKPGQSGNPGGRPKATYKIRDKALLYAPEAIDKLVEFMRGKDKKLALQAAMALLDRGCGKPAQVLIGDDDGPPIRVKGAIELVRPG